MTVPISKITFVNKAEVVGPKYYKDELTALKDSGATVMVQIPGFIKNEPDLPVKMVVGIDSKGHLMNDKDDFVVAPCPNLCYPPGTGGLITLTSFLNE